MNKAPASLPLAQSTTIPLAPAGHVVLADADSDSYRTLRRRPMSRAERFELGRSLRDRVPRSTLGDWKAPANRPDPVEQIRHSHEGRLDWLIPVRVGRMVASPYGFLRGTAIVMAEDVAALPATGITPVICGDAHLGNFGFYASPGTRPRDRPERLRRVASGRVGVGSAAARRQHLGGGPAHRCATEAQCHDSVASCVAAYRDGSAFSCERAAAVALLSADRRRPASRDRDRHRVARRDRPRGETRAVTGRAIARCRASRPSATAGAASWTNRR